VTLSKVLSKVLECSSAHGARVLGVRGDLTFLLLGCFLVVSPTAVGTQAPAAGNPATATQARGNPDTGKALFIAHQCFACHGYNGETGTRLLQEDGSFSPRLQTVDRFIAFIRAPRPGQPPPIGSSVSMPSYGVSSLPDERAADLFAYIRTFKPTEPALRDIPLLNQMLKEGGKVKN
jgi:mono/diheme cytochrome c family protein